MTAKLVWITPDADKTIGYLARVSNPSARPEDDVTRLIRYLIDHKHFSPFQMVSACVSVSVTRDIGRQIIRHRSLNFQEFSQRYAEVGQIEPSIREARLQDKTNRQNSLPLNNNQDKIWWESAQRSLWDEAQLLYNKALEKGIAKEQARALLPEGLTETKMYIAGTIRDWLHYLDVRTGPETQKEHRDVANEIKAILAEHIPLTFGAFFGHPDKGVQSFDK